MKKTSSIPSIPHIPHLRWYIAGGISFLFLLTLWVSYTSTVEGTARVILRFNQATGEVLQAGPSFIVPYVTTTETYNLKEQVIDIEDPSSGTKDLQTIAVSIRINYRLKLTGLVELHKRFNQKYEDIALKKAIPDVIKSTTVRYNVAELIQQRDKVAREMSSQFQTIIEKNYPGLFEIITFSIVDLSPTKAFMAAVEAKQIAEQEALRTRNQIEQTKAQAERDEAEAIGFANARRAKAQGEADAMKIEAEARAEATRVVGQALKEFPEMITMRGIESWDGKLPKVLGSTNGIILDKLLLDSPEKEQKRDE